MASSQRDSWQDKGNQQGRERFSRDARRVAVVLILVLLTWFLIRFLFPPFFAPQTHLVLIGSGDHQIFHAPPIPFVAEDQNALAALGAAVVHQQSELWESARTASQLSDHLEAVGLSRVDTLLMYLTAHGVSEDGKAYLLCDDFDLRRPESGRVSVEALLRQVSQSDAAVKVVFVNAGAIDYDPRLGMVVNEFPRLLEEAVRSTGDSSLWVFCSHSSLQYSHVSHAAQRSVFGMFISEGLRGAADLNRDYTVDLGELTAFASANVSRWARQSSDRGAEQTPRLMWGGEGDVPAADPSLVTLPRDSEPHVFNIVEFLDAADSPASSSLMAQQSTPSTGVLTRRHLAQSSQTTQDGGGEAKDDSSGEDAAGETGTEDDGGAGGDEAVADTDAAGSDDPESAGKPEDGPDPVERSRRLLADAWRLRDQASQNWSDKDPSVNPIEHVPHLWRELQEELFGFEQLLRSGSGSDPTAIGLILEQSLPQVSKTLGAAPTTIALVGKRQGSAAAVSGIALNQLPSIALAQLVAETQHETLGIDIDGLTAALEQETREPLDEWMKKNWRGSLSAYEELRFLKRASEEPDLEWNLLQLATQTCLAGERVAALDLWSPGWVREDVGRGDQLRYFAEELLFDRIGADWQLRASELFTQAAARYASAESGFRQIRRAEYLRDVVFDRSPHYLRWHQRMGDAAAGTRPSTHDLDTLLLSLSDLTDRLNRPGETSVVEVNRLRDNLESLQSRIEVSISDPSVQRFAQRTPTPGDAWRAEQLLVTPLASASARQSLLAAADAFGRTLASDFQPANVVSTDSDLQSRVGPAAVPTTTQWASLLQRAQLEARFVALCKITDPCRDETGAAARCMNDCQAVMDSFDSLVVSHDKVIKGVGDPPGMSPLAEQTVQSLWRAYGKLGVSLARFYREANVPSGGQVLCDQALLNTVGRSLRMLDARDAWRFRDVDLLTISAPWRTQSTIGWQSQRWGQASKYREQTDASTLVGADAGGRDRMATCGVLPNPVPTPQIDLVGQTLIDLQYTPENQLEFELRNSSVREVQVRLSLDYDHDLIRVTPVPVVANDLSSDTRLVPDTDPIESNSEIRQLLESETISLAAGERRRLGFHVTRRGQASQSTKLVIDAWNCSSELPAEVTDIASAVSENHESNCVLLARRTINVVLPVAEVFVPQAAGVPVFANGPLKLYPYPNRESHFRLGVVSDASITKEVTMGLYDLDVPFAEFTPDRYDELTAGKKPLAEFKLNVPGDKTPTFPAVEEEEPDAAATDDSKPDAAAEPEPEPEPAPIPTTELQHGLLVALTDMGTGQTTFRHVEFSVQRPRRFVRPRVGFNAATNRIEVDISALRRSLVPAGAAVRVDCRLADPSPGGTQGKLQGMIQSPDFSASLFIKMPSPPPQIATLYIDVDDYPRAFIFDVPCGKHVANVPEVLGLMDVRLMTSAREKFVAATNAIPVAIEVDAPVGSFEEGDDVVELGIDLNGTGVPDPATAVRLRTDRSVAVGFVKALPDGTVSLLADVSDFQVDLPSERLENVAVDVAAQIRLDSETRGIPSIPMFIDTAPPIVGPVKPINYGGFVPVAGQLELSAWAWDASSGVKRVEAVFDTSDSGEFPAEGEFIQATRESARQWHLSVTAGEDVGARTLLVRGVDRVGNPSDPIKVPLEIVSTTEGAARVEQQTVEVAGSVIFRDDLVPMAEVRLIAIDDQAADPPSDESGIVVQTSPDGRYSIPGVAPGAYVLNARGVINNRVRRTEQEITVSAGPERTIHVDVALP